MIRTLIAIPYKLARTPLALIDSTLSASLPEESLPRVTLDRVVGTSDKVAGALMGDPELAERGADRLERSGALRKAGKLEHEAERFRKQADRTVVDAHEEAKRKREAAAQRVGEVVDTADDVEARGKREARAKAKDVESAKKDEADRKAAQSAATIDQRKQRVESAADAQRETAQRAAASKLDHARSVDQAAAEVRADAQRLSDLADAKKRERKQD